MNLDADEIKRQAAGRCVQILASVCGLTDQQLNPRIHQPCPDCGGTDRFRAFDDVNETGGLLCNQCGSRSDLFESIQWLRRCTFPESVKLAADAIGITSTSQGNGHHRPATAKPPAKPKTSLERKPVKLIEPHFLKYLEVKGRDELPLLAERLTVSVDSLQALGAGFNPEEHVWTFPERTADGEVSGICRRFQDGDKKMMHGHKHGLYFSDNWLQGVGPVLIVEGVSDTAAAITKGLAAIGRPSAIVPRDVLPELVELLKRVPKDRGIIVVGENDQDLQHDDTRWPGKEGAERTAKQLTEALGRPILWALPPATTKDLRSWLKANPEATGHDFVDSLLIEQPEVDQAGDEATSAVSFAGQPAPELWYLADEPVRWMVEGVFSLEQPTVIGARKKSLKTTLLSSLVVSLVTGLLWLGRFKIPQKFRVLFITGEATKRAAIRKIRRAADALNVRAEDLEGLRIEAVNFPKFPSESDLAAISEDIRLHRIDIVVIDPLYRGMDGTVSAQNIFEMGDALGKFKAACHPASVILSHHIKKSAQFDKSAMPDLDDLSQAGVAEFAGNYLLIGRLARYEGNGMHDLAISGGGRDEQFFEYRLEFDERTFTGHLTDLRDHQAHQEQQAENSKVVEMVGKIIAELQALPDGESESKLASLCGTKPDRRTFRMALKELEGRGTIVCLRDFKQPRSKSCKGWKLAETTSDKMTADTVRADCPSCPS